MLTPRYPHLTVETSGERPYTVALERALEGQHSELMAIAGGFDNGPTRDALLVIAARTRRMLETLKIGRPGEESS